MPIEIKELIIRTNISEPGEGTAEINNERVKHIIEECVSQVLEILKRKKER